MTFRPPVADQRFLLEHVVRMAELQGHNAYGDATPDTVDAIVEGVADFAANEFAPLNRVGDTIGARWADGEVTMPPGFHEAYRAYVAAGWGTLNAAPEHGGQGLPFTLSTVVLEDLGSANMAFSLCPMLTAGAVEALQKHGSADLQARFLPKIVTGEWPATMNLTEPQAGSDVGALKTRATPRGDGTYLIQGVKIYITFGEHDLSDNIIHLVLARLPDAPAGTKGISLFLVPKLRVEADGSPGAANDVHCVSIEHKLGIHASPTCVMSYGDGGDCVGHIVGAENEGMRAMFTMMNNARLNVGLQGVSIAERATQAAVDYAGQRTQGSREGKPAAINAHPDVRRVLLRMKALTMGARSLLYYAAGQIDRGHLGDADARARADLLTPLAKAWGTDVGVEVAVLGIQIHGGMGYVEETGAAQHLRDARIAPIYEGTNGIQAADLVGRKLTLNGGAALASLIADMRAEAADAGLRELLDACEEIGEWMRAAPMDDRLAGSYPFLTMLSVAVAGWLLERQRGIAQAMAERSEGDGLFVEMKIAAADQFLATIVPEAIGLMQSALVGSATLYALPTEAFAA